MTRVVLVSMPYAPLFKPSIGLGLLQASLKANNITCSTDYACLNFASLTGVASYLRISESFPEVIDLAGEWVFSEALFGADSHRDSKYEAQVLRRTGSSRESAFASEFPDAKDPAGAFFQTLLDARRCVPDFLSACVERICAHTPDLVGFTSVFQQNVASIALSKLLHERLPKAKLVIGGANVEGSMGREVLRAFPWLDAVFSGEADVSFPEYVRRVSNGRSTEGIPGVLTRRAARSGLDACRSALVEDLDQLPDPDYDDYFLRFSEIRSQLDSVYQPHLSFESSRGCWWGEVSHCTFCGLNGTSMRFRSKTATRALDELQRLSSRHPGCPVAVVDNIIDNRYFQDFVPQLAERRLGLDLFYEVKANLRRNQVGALRAAGIRTIQPGIESLDSDVLTLMGKGIKAIANVQLLRFCAEEGVSPRWNLLWGFPGEPIASFQKMADLMKRLVHLPPPDGGFQIRLDRFSPNFNQWKERGFSNVRPTAAYGYVYPLSPEALAHLAYFFDYEYAEPYDLPYHAKILSDAIAVWRSEHARACLFSCDLDGTLLVWDLRPHAAKVLHVFQGMARALLLSADHLISTSQLIGDSDSEEDVMAVLALLEASALMMREGNAWLALPLKLEASAPTGKALAQFIQAASSMGTIDDQGDVVIEVSEDVILPVARADGNPHPLRLSTGHFSFTGDGRLRVRIAALRAIEWNRLRLNFSGLPTAGFT